MAFKITTPLFVLAILFATACAHEPVSDLKQPDPAAISMALSPNTETLTSLEVNVVGRVIEHRDGKGLVSFEQQWPGIYIEGAFKGEQVYFDVESTGLSLAISIDGQLIRKMVDAEPGRYGVSGLRDRNHTIRLQVVSENQSASSTFGGIYIDQDSTPLEPSHRETQIEFIGDSHTVGYANTSKKRDCTGSEVSRTTDTSLSIAGQLSNVFDADYQVNAISGRGVVRNYNGGDGATIPEQYPYTLLSPSEPYDADDWSPDLVVMSLGTNDFSTDLTDEEPWTSRDALMADYEATYLAFLETIMARYPDTHIIVWVAGNEGEEKYTSGISVVNQFKQTVSDKIGFVPVGGLSFEACHWHPTVDDAGLISREINEYIEANNILPL